MRQNNRFQTSELDLATNKLIYKTVFESVCCQLRRRQWHPTPEFLPGESQGRGNLVGCRLWGRTESDMTEVT